MQDAILCDEFVDIMWYIPYHIYDDIENHGNHMGCYSEERRRLPSSSVPRTIERTISAERNVSNMGKKFRETLNEQLRDPEFKAEWDALEPERQIVRAMLMGRERADLTQQQLAEATGIAQADISRLENGTANPSLRTLKRLASGMGMRLKVDFVPM